MKTYHQRRLIAGFGMAVMLLAGACWAQPAIPNDSAVALKRFLQIWDADKEKRTRYVAALHDLNGDGRAEAVVYLVSNGLCGKSGCPTLILRHNGRDWEVVTRVMLTRPPVRVSSGISNGWHNVSVWVDADEPHGGHEVELRYNGKTYPTEPADPALPRVQEGSEGEALILYAKDGVPLYD